MLLGSERKAVQEVLIKYACEVGWEYIPPEEALRLRGGEKGLIFREVFRDQLVKLNNGFFEPHYAEDIIKKLEKLPPSIEGNLTAWEYFKGLKTVFVPQERRERNVSFVDEKVLSRNVFHVTDEFSFSNDRYKNRYDVVFLINGFPVFFVETKAAHKIEGIAEALDQVRRYHRETPEALTLLQVYTLTHLIRFYYAATWNFSGKALLNWRLETKGADFETQVKAFFDRKRTIEVLLHYILFTRQDDELRKVVLRPHQMRAVQKILARAEEVEKHRGLIWHTQGSGKTYTMIVAAKLLLEDPLFENPTVIMLVDRNELEQQLFGNLSSVGFKQVVVANSKRHLRKLLAGDQRGLIVSTIQKFEGMPENINIRRNIFVLVDEAHRTTGGKLGNYLMGALPNATFFGFTGTPIDKTSHGKGTFITFGIDDPPKGYLDKYSIAESIEDGTTVKLHYTIAPNELRPEKEVLDKEFLELAEAEGVSDIEVLNKILEKAVNLKNMLKGPERVEKVAKYVAEHFRDYVEPLGYKAFLVAVDREACTFYKEALDKLLPPEYSAVVYSPFHNDPPHLKKYHLSQDEEQRIRKAFRDPKKLPKILIVTEKLLTGFDAPILYCMYLDKPMRDHVLLQAIARVNRPYEDEEGRKKPCGFVLDFVGIFDNLKKALAFDAGDIEGVVEDIEKLKERFKKLMDNASESYLKLVAGRSEDKAVEAVLKHFFKEDTRHEFYEFYRELSNIYEILSPDAFLRPYLEDYDTLSRMYRILKEAYEPGVIIDKELARKTAKLVQEHTKTGKIRASLEIYEINEHLLQKIEESKASDTEKVFNLLRSIENLVSTEGKFNPVLISIGERAEIISQLFKERQKSTQEILEELKKLIQEINQARREMMEKGMSKDVFAVYWLLKPEIKNAEDVAKETAKAFEKFPHWRSSEEHERKLKIELNKILMKLGKLNPQKAVCLTKDKIIRYLKMVSA